MIDAARRAKAVRWIASLNPLLRVISGKASCLSLGEPRLQTGPALMPRRYFEDQAGDRVRRGAVWFVDGRNCGFHVDFCANGQVHIEAWTGATRRISLWTADDVTEASLRMDLHACMLAAGLTDLAKTEEVRDQLFSKKARR